MSQQILRIGFVGAGSMGQCAHLRNYALLDGCQVVALAEIREDLRREAAARYGIPRVYATHRDMLAQEDLDGIVVAQPFRRHGALIPELLRAGAPVFTEKPLAGSVQVGERIADAVAHSGTWHMLGYHKRSDLATMWAREQIDELKSSGALGRMTYVRILMPAGDWIASGFDDMIRTDAPYPELAWDPPDPDMDEETFKRYTSFVNYYIHQVNLMRYLLGEPYAVTYAEPSGIVLAGQSESGIPCTIEMSPYTTSIDWQESALVCFEHGYLRLELPAPLARNRPGRVELFSDPGQGARPQTVIPQHPWVDAMRQQAIHFLAAIRGQTTPPCEAAEALEDLRVARSYIQMLAAA
ncbi:MAG TPA: Gfo/Idh/MocA family oxidoreductase [Anaerolineae bacterium]|nr:Gfo/Idh/MocA family oxidoreductase [Anaerolineae bacterium]